MTPECGQRVYAVFEAALKCGQAGRAALIKELSGDDPQLAAEVERLLTQDAEAERDRFMADPASTDRDAPRRDESSHGKSDFDSEQSPEGTSTEKPIPATALPPGLAEHPDYAIKRELGWGGMGVVYLAENRLMGRHEALKVIGWQITPRPEMLERFLREIRAVAKLHHPNIVTAYHAVRLGESIVLAMEYVDGLDLSRIVRARGPLPVANACSYIHQAALGLEHAHERGMVHRDIKPSNLMLARQCNRDVVKVLDFGLGKIRSNGPTDWTLTHEGQMLGTPDFIAPEQISDAGRADIRADIYSLGCTLYFLLTGRPPFGGTSLYDILQAHHSVEATPLNLVRAEVPGELAALVGKMMAKDPEQRFQSPAEVAEALTPFLDAGTHPESASSSMGTERPPAGVKPSPKVTPTPAAVSRPPWVWATAATLLFMVVAASVLIIRTRNGTIVFENLPEQSVVTVDGEILTVEWPDGKGKGRAQISISPGKRSIAVKVNGVRVSGEEVDVEAGGLRRFVVRMAQIPVIAEPPLPPSGPSDTQMIRAKNSIGMSLVVIPAGQFVMGCPDCGANDAPPHRVRISQPFYLGACEVTQEQYQTIMGNNPSRFLGQPRNPVDSVTWVDAVTFCNRLSQRENLPEYYRIADRDKVTIRGGIGYRLPTEAEWEYACRAGDPNNRPFDDDAHLGQFAWMMTNSVGTTHAVGEKAANSFGLYDMYGNVWEWCWDWLGDYPTHVLTDPKGPDTGTVRVLHGNGWYNGDHRSCRPSWRHYERPGRTSPNHDFGFRVAAGGTDGLPIICAESPARTSRGKARALPLGGSSHPRSTPETIVNTIGMELTLIPAGDFAMGSPDNDVDALPDERPQHPVRISKAFYLGIHEVTRGRFRQFAEKTGYRTDAEKDPEGGWGWSRSARFEPSPRYTWLNPGFEQTDEHPAVIVSWTDAVEFCKWLSRTEGKTYRLPTEAEWEYACRAGTTTRFFCGNDPETLAAVANVRDGTLCGMYPGLREMIAAKDGFGYTAPVGQFKPNNFGLYDMHGNVHEWCSDGYDEKYYRHSPGVDPSGSPASIRAFRGGGWVDRPMDVRSAGRHRERPNYQIGHVGFRVAMEQSPP
ncbi:MAG: SUMF1/EgtB/PvdO family nonheme iron enzyme [Isosphaeraceae bacterium]